MINAAELVEEFSRDNKIKSLPNVATWDDSSLEELLETYALVENKKSGGNLKKGDIVLVNAFESQNGQETKLQHRLYYYFDTGENSVEKRTFFGFLLSTKVAGSNYYNKRHAQDIYIDSYNSILTSGQISDVKPVKIELNGMCTWKYKDEVQVVGRASEDFIKFIDDLLQKIRQKEDTSKIYWLSGGDN